MRQRRSLLVLVIAVLAAAFTASSGAAAAKHATFKCPRGGLAGTACVAPGAPCAASSRSLYAERGFVCAHRRLHRGGLALEREGGAFAVQANGEVSLAEAEQAFIAIYGPLPGVKRVPGAVALLPDADVTGPRLWIRHYLPRLKPAQRRAVERTLDPPAVARAAKKNNALLDELEPILIERIRHETGIPFTLHTVVYEGNAAELGKGYGGKPSGGYAEPIPGPDGETIVKCEVLILDKEAAEYSNAVRVEGHELTHCAQDSLAGTISRVYSQPLYFTEGYALWAGDRLQTELTGQTFDDPGLIPWINNPFKDLYKRIYDGGGIYDEVADATGQSGLPWAILAPLSAAHSASGIYGYLKGLAGADFERNLATNALLSPSLGQQWTFDGSGITPATERPDLRDIALDNGDSTTLGAPIRAVDRAEVDFAADIVTVAGSAPGGLHLSDGRTLDVAPTRLCNLEEGCRCPNGDNPTDEGGAKGRAVIAFLGEQSGNKVTLTGESLSEACHEKVTTPPSGEGGSGVGVKLENINKATIASFAEAASCSLSGSTLTAHLSPVSGGGTQMLVKLSPVHAGQSASFQFHDPADGPLAEYGSYTTNAPTVGTPEEGPGLLGDGSYDGGQRFFLGTNLLLPGTSSGALAVGYFTCPKAVV